MSNYKQNKFLPEVLLPFPKLRKTLPITFTCHNRINFLHFRSRLFKVRQLGQVVHVP